MQVRFSGARLVLVPQTEAERADFAAWLEDRRDHVFQLDAPSLRGAALADLGPREEACHIPINIVLGEGDARWWPISNLAATPFLLHGRLYASVEGFWQGLKFVDDADRARVAALSGSEAKRAGGNTPDSFVYDQATILSGSRAHWRLMELACRAKFSQHGGAQEALLATGTRPLAHITRRDSVTIPGIVMADIWMRVRAALRDGERWRALAAAQNADGRILFFDRDRDRFGFLSHFHPSPFTLDGEAWPTVEHYYQFQKSFDPRYRAAIRAAATPGQAKQLAATSPPQSPLGERAAEHSWFVQNQAAPRPDWQSVKLDIMRRAEAYKYDQNPDLRARLLATGSLEIVEDSPFDDFWGIGRDGQGANWAGRVLMEVRARLAAVA